MINLQTEILLTLSGKSEVQKVYIPQNWKMRFICCVFFVENCQTIMIYYIKMTQLFEDNPVHNNRPKIFRPFRPDKI